MNILGAEEGRAAEQRVRVLIDRRLSAADSAAYVEGLP